MARAVVELDSVGVDRGDPDPQPHVRAGRGQLLQRIIVGLVGELSQQGVAPVDQGDLARHRQPPGLLQRQHQLGQRSGGLDPGRAAPDDDYVDRNQAHGTPHRPSRLAGAA